MSSSVCFLKYGDPDMQQTPLISVVMPAYNHHAYVGEAVASVLAQSHRHLELIVIDDGSTDGTGFVLSDFDDPRMQVVHQRNAGSHAALNRGIRLARGEYVAILNSDDRFHPDRLVRLLAESQRGAFDFLVTDFRLIDANGEPINDPAHEWLARVEPFRRRCRELGPLAGLLHGNFTISTSNFFFRREIFSALGPLRRYRYVQDWEYALRAVLRDPQRFGFLDEALFDYRLHGANTILNAGVRCSSEIVRMYARALGGAKPEWYEPLSRLLHFSLDIRRTLAGRVRADAADLVHLHHTVTGQAAHIKGQDAHHAELGAAIQQLQTQVIELHAQVAVRDRQIESQSTELVVRARHIESQGAELAARARHIDRLDKELATIYRSWSWRLSRPVRGLGRALRQVRSRLQSPAREFWHRLPLPPQRRFAFKSLIFRHAGFLFRGTPAYSSWLQQCRWAQAAPSVLAALPTVSVRPQAPTVERRLIPGGVAAIPRVSVVIPVYNNLDYTLACLDAIARHLPAVPIEVIVVDDASSDATEAELSVRTDLRYLRNPANLGFIGSCNRGAAEAHGEFVFFLNNDTTVLEGWLDTLVATFDAIPEAGLVGSKLIYPDGRLQEAGGIIWEDASGWNWGRLADPAAPEFNFLRDVDYCSGAAILIRRELFTGLGGFDTRYAPAYYEDTDLAFAVRAHGLRVLYQPLSQVVHYEGVTSGTDLGSGIKAYQVRNRERFLDKWQSVLVTHGSAEGRAPRLSADRRPQARMLVIDACTPTPDQDSGSIDMVNLLRMLDDFGYRVSFIPESDLLFSGAYTRALQGRGVECLYHPYTPSVEQVLQARGEEFDAVMLVRGPHAYHYVDMVKRYCPRAKIIFNTVDLHFLREQRKAQLETGSPRSAMADEMRRKEMHVIERADTTIVISPVEQELLAREAAAARVRVIPLLREIPGRSQGFGPRRGIVFVGGFRHPPNIDAMLWFCAEIWPLVRARLPGLECFIIGSHMAPEVQALDGNGVHVLGFVEDIEPVFRQVRLSIAPLRYGAGLKGKVATSLGYGVPCVLSQVAVEGSGLEDGVDVLVADTPQAFADAVVRLHEDGALWERLSRTGLTRVESEFSVAANRGRLAALLAELGLPARSYNHPTCVSSKP